MYLSISSKYYDKGGWQINDWYVTSVEEITLKETPDADVIEPEILSREYVNIKKNDDLSVVSSQYVEDVYTVEDKYKYCTISGNITANKSLVSYSESYPMQYHWQTTVDDSQIAVKWDIEGTEMENDFTEVNESENSIGAEDGETEALMETGEEVNDYLRSGTGLIEIDEANFPDTVFREYVRSEFDLNGDNKLEADELICVEYIGVGYQGVANLKGIEFFTNLRQLNCMGNNLTKLDVSANTALESLDCARNNLTKLDLSKNTALEELECRDNNLPYLDLSSNVSLYSISCEDNIYTIQNNDIDTNSIDGFDNSKATNWTNAKVNGTIISIVDPEQKITYSYQIRDGETETFSLILDRSGELDPEDNEEYYIDYELNGGINHSENPVSYIQVDDTITLKEPTRTGYTFDGWFKDSAFKIQITSIPTGTAENITAYVKWLPNKYTVTFNANGGSTSTTTKSATYDSTYDTLPTPTRAGYTFKGWYTAKNEGEKITAESKVSITKNQTLYAQWSAKKYTVTFNANSGSVKTKSKSVTYASTYGTLPSPTRSKYEFKGWYTKKSGGTKITKDSKVSLTKNQTLYARWSKVSASKGKVSTVTNSSSKQAKVTIKKISSVKGYQIEYATNKDFKSSRKTTSTGTTVTLKLLSKGKTYYVRVRGYKLDSKGAKIYGSWSTAKTVKITN